MLETPYGPVHLDHCHPYLRDEIALIGDADPFVSQRALPDRLVAALDGLPDAALDFKPAPSEWSTREVVAHLVQSEIVYGYRYRTILAEPEALIAGYDQERWTPMLPEAHWPLGVLLDHLRSLKALNVSVLEQTTREERARWGVHSERGKESIAALIGAIAGHDHMHEAQIAANLAAWRESRSAS
ncbi:MAG: DinB family protein, partial [Ardenticatenales bacterium]